MEHSQRRTDNRSPSGYENRQPLAIDLSKVKFGNIDEKLFDTTAEEMAKTIFGEGNSGKNKSTQLRKFYDELVMWHDRVFTARDQKGKASQEAQKEEYGRAAPFIKMLCAKVAYAKGRGHVSEGFEKLFTHVVRNITNPETLKQAKLFIEAFMGFYKAEEK
jgi:CRISPR-associated protein Csm2